MKKHYLPIKKAIDEAKFAYYSVGKAFENQIKANGDRGERKIKALEENEKQLVKSSNE